MRFTRTKSNCKACPLRGRKPVKSLCETDKPSIVIIGDAPDKASEEAGKPFQGGTGNLLRSAAYRAGIVFEQAHRMNVICCRPTDGASDFKEASECCKAGFLEELAELRANGAKVIMALGPEAAKAVGIQESLQKARGSVYEFEGLPAIATFHPQFILRGQWAEETTWSSDMIKVKDISLGKWKKLKEKFNLFPTVADLKAFVEKAIAKQTLVGVDIEGFKHIMMIGLSVSAEEALVVPFIRQGGHRYWSDAELPKVQKLLKELFLKCPTMFQNAQFDVYALESQGYKFGNVKHDTMLLHHSIHPELPHKLGYIVSVYGKTPYWKDVVLKSDTAMWELPDEVIRTYNARDCVVLHQVLPAMLEDLKEIGTENTYYNYSMKLLRPLMMMRRNGLKVDAKRLNAAKRLFKKTADEAEEKIRELCELPTGFNFDSGDHMRRLFYGVEPPSYKKALESLKEYESNPKKSRETKKYKELIEKVEVIGGTKPLYQTSAKIRKTDAGSDAIDNDAMVQLSRACFARMEAMEYLTRRKPSHDQEAKDIEKLLAVLKLRSVYQENHKLLVAFTKLNVDTFARIHPQYKIHGTATGRLSASDPNPQQFPPPIQSCIVADDGYVIIKADYSNIEYRVMAIVTGETWLENEFNKGVNFHDINTKLLFGIEKDDPDWDNKRRLAKTFIFGLSYGGSVGGIYKQIITGSPDCGLTLSAFSKIVKEYFEKLPKYAKWREDIQRQACTTRIVSTAFGRKRILLGTEDEISRQALNTPIQGSAGEIAEQAIINLTEAVERKPEWDAKLICTVHDSILVEAKQEFTDEVALAMKSIMEQEVTINGRKCRFPVDIEVGSSWGETEKWKVKEVAKGGGDSKATGNSKAKRTTKRT